MVAEVRFNLHDGSYECRVFAMSRFRQPECLSSGYPWVPSGTYRKDACHRETYAGRNSGHWLLRSFTLIMSSSLALWINISPSTTSLCIYQMARSHHYNNQLRLFVSHLLHSKSLKIQSHFYIPESIEKCLSVSPLPSSSDIPAVLALAE